MRGHEGHTPPTDPEVSVIGIGLLVAVVPAVVMGIGAVLCTLWILRSPMFHVKADAGH